MTKYFISSTFISVALASIFFSGCNGSGTTQKKVEDNTTNTPEQNTTKDQNTTQTDPNIPVFANTISSNITIQENKVSITTISATPVTSYSIDSGADKKWFTIDPQNGTLKFFHFVPDFEHPADANKDNKYEITIAATNEGEKATKDMIISVTNDTSDDNAGAAVVLKTGVDDGPNGPGYGDDRGTATGLNWEDSNHINEDINWDDAAAYCASLGMRLPTRKELFTLVNYAKFPNTLIDDSFNNKNSGLFWTNANLLRGAHEVATKAWAIDFKFGGDLPYDKTESADMHVRCVSGAASFSTSGNFSDNGATITDSLTGLIWEHDEAKTLKKLTWAEAKQRCEAKGADWRLPNINELHTLMPENEMNILLINIIGDQPYSTDPAWSSTPIPGNPNNALYIGNYEYNAGDNIHLGDTQNNEEESKDNNGSIRSICVRGGHL